MKAIVSKGGDPEASPAATEIGGVHHGIVETQYYPFVDGLRGVAILMVLAVHSPHEGVAPAALESLVSSGARGVQLFFILSAFTLLSTSLQRFPHERHPRRNFYLRRAFRILPLWWLCIGCYAVALTRFGEVFDRSAASPSEMLLDGLFLFGFSPDHMRALVPGGWSLFVEESFYWLLPLVVGLVSDRTRAATLTLGLLALSIVWYPVSLWLMQGDPRWADFYFFFPFSQWFIFGVGFVLYFVILARKNARLPLALALLWDGATVILLWAAFVSRPIGPAFFVAAVALAALCFAVSQPNSSLALLVDTALMRAFGQCCYSIYLAHQLLLRIAEPMREPILAKLGLTSDHPDLRFVGWFALMALVALAIGQASFRLFEKPLVQIGKRTIAWLDARDPLPLGQRRG